MLLLIQHIRYSFSMHIQFHQHFMLNMKTGNINFVLWVVKLITELLMCFPKVKK
jgi:hypothetical protein